VGSAWGTTALYFFTITNYPCLCSPTNCLTPYIRVLPEKLTGSQLFKKLFPRILCNPKIHYRLQKVLPPVSSDQRLGLPSGSFPSGLTTKLLYAPLMFHIRVKAQPVILLLPSFKILHHSSANSIEARNILQTPFL
jgi:hypothetical protein